MNLTFLARFDTFEVDVGGRFDTSDTSIWTIGWTSVACLRWGRTQLDGTGARTDIPASDIDLYSLRVDVHARPCTHLDDRS